MRFITNLLVAFSVLASFAGAAPAPDPSLVEKPLSIAAVEETQSPTSPLLARGDNYCSPTGPESCNFWIGSTIPLFGSGYQRWWKLFDHSCRGIGGDDGSLPVNGPYSLTSELPYTIELTIESGGFTPNGYFWYAGRRTNLGDNMYCESCSGLTAMRCCRVAFRCR